MSDQIIPYDIEKFDQQIMPKEYAYSKLNINKLEFVLTGSLSKEQRLEVLESVSINEFRIWALKYRKPLDWRIALFLLTYILSRNIDVSIELAVKLIAISASRWAYLDKSSREIIFLRCNKIPKNIIKAEKSKSPMVNRSILLYSSTYADIHNQVECSFYNIASFYESIENYA